MFDHSLKIKHWKLNIVALPILAACVLLALSPLFQGRFYAIGDMRDVYIPLELFFQKELGEGRLPAWNPDAGWGFPVIASGQIGFFYPPLLIGRLLFPLWLYLPLVLVLHFLAMALGMYAFIMRLLPHDNNVQRSTFNVQSSSAALFGALAFTLSQFVWQHMTHLNLVLAIAWLPWQMIWAHRIATRKRISLRDTAILVILLGIPFLIGHPQIPFYSALLCSAYIVFQRWQRWKTILKPSLLMCAVAIGVLSLSAAQLLPTYELLQYSSRSSKGDFDIERANMHSYPLYHLPTLLFPRFYGNDDTYWGKILEIEYGFYIGVIPLLLALWAIRKKLENGKWKMENADKHQHFFFWLLIITFLLALGNFSPFRLVGLEPSLWVFSSPARFLLFATFSLSIFAAIGFQKLNHNSLSFIRFAKIAAALIIAAVLISNIFLHVAADQESLTSLFGIEGEYYIKKVSSLLMSARASSISLTSSFSAVSLVPLIALPFILNRRFTKQIILAVTSVELIIIATTTTPTLPWSNVLQPPETVHQLPDAIKNKQARIFSVREGGDTGKYFTNPETRATSETRELQRRLLVPMINAQFGIPGIEWPASLDLYGHEQTLVKLRGEHGYHVSNQKVAEELNVGAILSEKNQKVVIQELSPLPRAELAATHTAAAYIEKSPGHAHIQVNTPKPSTLIIRNTFFPGWSATIGNSEVEIGRYNAVFQSLQVPAGSYTVEMTYRPLMLYLGIAVSVSMLVLLAFILSYKSILFARE